MMSWRGEQSKARNASEELLAGLSGFPIGKRKISAVFAGSAVSSYRVSVGGPTNQ
jgi:hypothetical protein